MPFSCAQLSSRKLPALPEMTSIALHGRNQMCECEILDQTEVKTRTHLISAGNNNKPTQQKHHTAETVGYFIGRCVFTGQSTIIYIVIR